MRELYKEIFKDNEAPATIFNIAIIKLFGSQCYNWEFETIWLEIMEETGLEEISDIVKDKIRSIIVLNTCERFYESWDCFENICHAFNDNEIIPDIMTPLEPEEVTWGIMEAKLNDETFSSFGYDVDAYIETVFKSNGISILPPLLKDIASYNSYNEFDHKMEMSKQAWILSYCITKAKKIIEKCKYYFDFDMTDGIKEEFPAIKNHI